MNDQERLSKNGHDRGQKTKSLFNLNLEFPGLSERTKRSKTSRILKIARTLNGERYNF
jgi:hypothetical protein